MTTPAPLQTEPNMLKLSTDAPAAVTAEELERYARLENLQSGLRRARALGQVAKPPPAGPRDLTGISAAMTTAKINQGYYWHVPSWHALRDIPEQVDDALSRLNEQAETNPKTAIHAAKITTLAASLIARHAAKVSAVLDAGGQRETPGGRAMRVLTRVAEAHALQASGLDSVQALDTPRLLIAHIHKLNKELRRAQPDDPEQDLGLDDPDDPELDSALSIGAAADPELAEASQLMTALSELAGRGRRAGHRLTLDVRLHGMVETAQLRGFEMISGIARAVMRRYDNQGQGTSGGRNIAATIYHYAEQRLERMRGVLDTDEQRDFGHYETDPPKRYMDALLEESRTANWALRDKDITPQERMDLQIRVLLARKKITVARGIQDWGTQATFPPSDIVGMQTDRPVEARLDLIDALRRRVENNPFHDDAPFLNEVKDRLAQELAGPPELTAQALEADLQADQVRAVAAHLVERGTVASPLVLSETAELDLSHAQAERALDVLQTLNVVGPPNGLKPRETLTASRDQLPSQLQLLEERLPNLLEIQKGAAAVAAFSAPTAPTTAAQPETAPAAEAPTAAEPEQTQAPAAPPPPAPAEPAPAAKAKLPRRDKSVERRGPSNLGTRRPTPAVETPSDPDLAKLLEGREDQLKKVSQSLITGKEVRAADHPAPAEAAPAKPTPTDEAQHNARQVQQGAGVGVR
ncbi:hypothetical protein [Streptomyces botrytidirepellens]|uniref:Uncharacterized protein n=1 Tax=Streptomyces botrytidirepellens TaxID=2486417 RepID=A0A3M8W911_9ACTN|nr:hypothetical protein [Streptomyces botrytidirepellens]RNG26040.1 hypothetical protein EEJ42_16350 [Streptomyces botrytidirepellens]